MRKERTTIPVRVLEQNNGQLDWLPKNPRQWTKDDIDRTAASIREDEDFLEDRPLLVCPDGPKSWVVFAGNLRLTAAKKVGLKEVPCVVYYATDPEADFDTIKRRAMKDNGSFGSWDYDTLANEWGDLPLGDWGVPAWNADIKDPDSFGENFSLPDGERVPFQQMSFQLADEQVEIVKDALEKVKATPEYKEAETFGNENSNANALALIALQWIELRT